jgi:hypothetical protein
MRCFQLPPLVGHPPLLVWAVCVALRRGYSRSGEAGPLGSYHHRVSTEAPESEPEILTTGTQPMGARTRRRLLTVLIGCAVIVAAILGWRAWPRPAPPFSLVDLQGVYAGMVRSDGTNDASVLSRENFADSPAAVDPAACEPLFEATTFSLFPSGALDGVGTYWPDARVAISLFTFRFADPASAQHQLDRVDTALTDCVGQTMRILPGGRDEPPTQRIDARTGVLTRTAVEPLAGVRRQAAYLFTTDDKVKFAVEVFAYNNLVSWQFRYDPQPGPYDPTAAGQLNYALATQIQAVEQSRP